MAILWRKGGKTDGAFPHSRRGGERGGRRRGRKIAPIYVRKGEKEARRKLKVENEKRDEKISRRFAFPEKRAILFIDKKILSFAL